MTIREIAAQAGVSPAAVSLVINNKKGVSEETRKRILAVMEESGYSPTARKKGEKPLKIVVLNTLLGFASVVLCWTFIVPFAASICCTILFVVRIICFVQICKGKAIEPPIVNKFKFLS